MATPCSAWRQGRKLRLAPASRVSATGDWPLNELQQLGYLLRVVDTFLVISVTDWEYLADSHFGELRVSEQVNVLCTH